MEQKEKPFSELKAIREFFGQLPGQTFKEFAAELKALTPEEKRELAEGSAMNLGVPLEPAKEES